MQDFIDATVTDNNANIEFNLANIKCAGLLSLNEWSGHIWLCQVSSQLIQTHCPGTSTVVFDALDTNVDTHKTEVVNNPNYTIDIPSADINFYGSCDINLEKLSGLHTGVLYLNELYGNLQFVSNAYGLTLQDIPLTKSITIFSIPDEKTKWSNYNVSANYINTEYNLNSVTSQNKATINLNFDNLRGSSNVATLNDFTKNVYLYYETTAVPHIDTQKKYTNTLYLTDNTNKIQLLSYSFLK